MVKRRIIYFSERKEKKIADARKELVGMLNKALELECAARIQYLDYA